MRRCATSLSRSLPRTLPRSTISRSVRAAVLLAHGGDQSEYARADLWHVLWRPQSVLRGLEALAALACRRVARPSDLRAGRDALVRREHSVLELHGEGQGAGADAHEGTKAVASELVHFPLPAPLSIAERLVPCRSLLAPDWNHVRYTQLARLFPTFHRTGSHSSASGAAESCRCRS